MVLFPLYSSSARSDTPRGLLVWWGALALFVVAAVTGALFRFGVAYGPIGDLSLTNIRHAHSHLIYFGWGTPALMALIWHHLPPRTTAPYRTAFFWVVGGTFGAAVIAYPLFLLFGYAPVLIGPVRMPIAVLGAALNIVGWYGFIALYAVATRSLPRTPALQLWDMACTLLMLATLGAWGLSLLKPLGVSNPLLASALTHVFLDLFSEGWFIVGLLGVAVAIIQPSRSTEHSWAFYAIGAGLPFTFLLALPISALPVTLRLLGRGAGLLVGLGLLVVTGRLLYTLLRLVPSRQWMLPLGFLSLKASVQVANSILPGAWWATDAGLRILYLHLMLLGFFSLGLVAAARSTWGPGAAPQTGSFRGAVLLLLATLLPLTAWWPAAYTGPWTHIAAAWTSLLPGLAAAWMLARALYARALWSPLSAEATDRRLS